MKYLSIFISFFLFITCKTTVYNRINEKTQSNNPIDSLSLLFKKIDYSTYIGRSIEELLEVSPLNNNRVLIETIDEPVGALSYTQLVYSNKVFIFLYPDTENLKYVKKYSSTLKWDFNMVKKEKIRRIRLFVEGEELIFSKGYFKRYSR
jgi:hypothetical protein